MCLELIWPWTSREPTLIFFCCLFGGISQARVLKGKGAMRAGQHLNSASSELRIGASLREGNREGGCPGNG